MGRVVEDLKDESEPYRRMVMETIDKVVKDLGSADIDARLEELLIDGILYAFQEQVCPSSECRCSVFLMRRWWHALTSPLEVLANLLMALLSMFDSSMMYGSIMEA